eukprot:scaffold22123_cov64-Phaeocystis_antarctica.AAC.3
MAAGRRLFPAGVAGTARPRALGTDAALSAQHHACLELRCPLGTALFVTDHIAHRDRGRHLLPRVRPRAGACGGGVRAEHGAGDGRSGGPLSAAGAGADQRRDRHARRRLRRRRRRSAAARSTAAPAKEAFVLRPVCDHSQHCRRRELATGDARPRCRQCGPLAPNTRTGLRHVVEPARWGHGLASSSGVTLRCAESDATCQVEVGEGRASQWARLSVRHVRRHTRHNSTLRLYSVRRESLRSLAQSRCGSGRPHSLDQPFAFGAFAYLPLPLARPPRAKPPLRAFFLQSLFAFLNCPSSMAFISCPVEARPGSPTDTTSMSTPHASGQVCRFGASDHGPVSDVSSVVRGSM